MKNTIGRFIAAVLACWLAAPLCAQEGGADTVNQLLEEYHIELKILSHKIQVLEEELKDMEFRADRIAEDQERLYRQKGLRINGTGRVWWDDMLVGGPAVGFLPNEETRTRDTKVMYQFNFNGRPDEKIMADCEIRLYFPLGGEWGTGNYLQFRRTTLGIKTKTENYDFGSILLKKTPLTMWCPLESYPREPLVFRQIRAQGESDDFVNGADTHVVGCRVVSKRALPWKTVRELNFFAAAVAPNNWADPDYDQFLGVGHCDLGIGGKTTGMVGGNVVWQQDLAGTGGGQPVPPIRPLRDIVAGGEGRLDLFEQKLSFGGEVNTCRFEARRAGIDFQTTDSALRVGGEVNLRDRHQVVRTHVGLDFIDVGPYYYAFTAQSRPFNPLRQQAFDYSNLYTFYNPGFVKSHAFNLFYDINLLTGAYRPFSRIFNNTSPYGLATPNRRGFSLNYLGDYGDKILQPSLGVKLQDEIQQNWVFDYYDVDGKKPGYRSVEVIGAGATAPASIATRNYLVVDGGLGLDPLRLKWKEKSLHLQANLKLEKTTNGDPNGLVDLQTRTTQLGVEGKLLESLTILFGLEDISVKDGQEYFLQATGISTSACQHLLYGFYNNFYVSEGLVDRYVHSTFDLSQRTIGQGVLIKSSPLSEIVIVYLRTDYSMDLKGQPTGLNNERAQEVLAWLRLWW